MSKYKHKTSGKIAIKNDEWSYFIEGVEIMPIPKNLIENPDYDWEKVEEPFKEGEWRHLLLQDSEMIFRFKQSFDDTLETDEYYQVKNDSVIGSGESNRLSNRKDDHTRATPEQIERILSVVARHKGYNKGKEISLIKGRVGTKGVLESKSFTYSKEDDSLVSEGGSSYTIYQEGTWAEIAEEPKEAEPQVETGLNATCLVTGKRENLRMHAARNDKGQMVGWCFINESVDMSQYEIDVNWMDVSKKRTNQ